MRLALPGSAVVHASALVLLLAGLPWPEADDAAPPMPMTVSIVPMSVVSANAVDTVQSDSLVSAVSAGSIATPLTSLPSETLEALPSETLDPLAEAAVPPPQSVVAPVEPALIELSTTGESLVAVAAHAALQPLAAEVVPVEDLSAAPVPQQISRPRQSEPIVHRPRAPKPPSPQPQQTAGNGGKDDGDAQAASGGAPQQVASNGSGGDAEVARYPSQVIGKLRRALRRANGPAGEVIVRFTVLADGQLADVAVARSSGNGQVDGAGAALVRRAAPYPPIPTGAGRSNWTFDVPLAFGG